MIDPGLRTKDTEPEARDMGASRGGGDWRGGFLYSIDIQTIW